MNSMRRKAVQYQYVVRPPRALFDVMTRSQDKQRKMTPAAGVLGPSAHGRVFVHFGARFHFVMGGDMMLWELSAARLTDARSPESLNWNSWVNEILRFMREMGGKL